MIEDEASHGVTHNVRGVGPVTEKLTWWQGSGTVDKVAATDVVQLNQQIIVKLAADADREVEELAARNCRRCCRRSTRSSHSAGH
jgi:hypothetical protein